MLTVEDAFKSYLHFMIPLSSATTCFYTLLCFVLSSFVLLRIVLDLLAQYYNVIQYIVIYIYIIANHFGILVYCTH